MAAEKADAKATQEIIDEVTLDKNIADTIQQGAKASESSEQTTANNNSKQAIARHQAINAEIESYMSLLKVKRNEIINK